VCLWCHTLSVKSVVDIVGTQKETLKQFNNTLQWNVKTPNTNREVVNSRPNLSIGHLKAELFFRQRSLLRAVSWRQWNMERWWGLTGHQCRSCALSVRLTAEPLPFRYWVVLLLDGLSHLLRATFLPHPPSSINKRHIKYYFTLINLPVLLYNCIDYCVTNGWSLHYRHHDEIMTGPERVWVWKYNLEEICGSYCVGLFNLYPRIGR